MSSRYSSFARVVLLVWAFCAVTTGVFAWNQQCSTQQQCVQYGNQCTGYQKVCLQPIQQCKQYAQECVKQEQQCVQYQTVQKPVQVCAQYAQECVEYTSSCEQQQQQQQISADFFSLAMAVYEEVLLSEMDFIADEETYYFSCPCGDQFSITLEALRRGEDIAPCNSCSLKIKVLYNKDSLQQCKAALPLALAVPVS